MKEKFLDSTSIGRGFIEMLLPGLHYNNVKLAAGRRQVYKLYSIVWTSAAEYQPWSEYSSWHMGIFPVILQVSKVSARILKKIKN
jgi:hypothetical protein